MRYKFAYAIRKYASTGGSTESQKEKSKELLDKAHDAAVGIALGLPAATTTVGALGGAGTGYLLGKAFGKDATRWGIGGALAGGGIGLGAAAPFSAVGLMGAHESRKIRDAIADQKKEAGWLLPDSYKLHPTRYGPVELTEEEDDEFCRRYGAAVNDYLDRRDAAINDVIEARKREPFFKRKFHDFMDGRQFPELERRLDAELRPDREEILKEFVKEKYPDKFPEKDASFRRRVKKAEPTVIEVKDMNELNKPENQNKIKDKVNNAALTYALIEAIGGGAGAGIGTGAAYLLAKAMKAKNPSTWSTVGGVVGGIGGITAAIPIAKHYVKKSSSTEFVR